MVTMKTFSIPACESPYEGIPPDVTLLHRAFEHQARSHPGSAALFYRQQVISYGELLERAMHIRSHIPADRSRVGSRIGVHLDRGPDQIAAILAILFAGCAYVPIDPRLPAARCRFIQEDADLSLVVSSSPSEWAIDECITVLPPPRASGLAESQPEDRSEINPEDPAYVIYTSGSTGQPKGVIVSHTNVVSLMRSAHDIFQIKKSDRWTLFHSISFDFSVWEIWGALAFGGTLVIPDEKQVRDPDDFAALLGESAITMLSQTPTAFKILQASANIHNQTHSLRYIFFGGEKLEYSSLKPWIMKHGDERPQLINMYGITETTVHVTSRRVLQEEVLGSSPSFIGDALKHLRIYLLNSELDPVGIGDIGQICVAGKGVSAGYLRRPKLTEERFVVARPAQDAPVRLYLSGDLGRLHANGEIEYIGRADRQIKVRGYRIELGEIEAAALDVTGCEAAVATMYSLRGNPRIALHLLGPPSDPARVRSDLGSVLPSHMIPDHIQFITEIPMTSNGKLDRLSLPLPTGAVFT